MLTRFVLRAGSIQMGTPDLYQAGVDKPIPKFIIIILNIVFTMSPLNVLPISCHVRNR